MENLRDKRHAAAKQGDKLAQRKLDRIKKYDREKAAKRRKKAKVVVK